MKIEVEPQQFIKWIKTDNKNAITKFLMSGTHHGKPGCSASVKSLAIELIEENLNESKQYEWAIFFSKHKDYVPRVIATKLLLSGWKNNKVEVKKLMIQLAEDDDWEVREWIAGTLSDLARMDFNYASKLYLQWSKAGSPELRRAIAVGLKYKANDKNKSDVLSILDIYEPMMSDNDSYLKKNLGPFAIGDGVLPRFPKETIRFLESQSKVQCDSTKWNVIMSFTSAASKNFQKEGLKILQSMKPLKEKLLLTAIKKAENNLKL